MVPESTATAGGAAPIEVADSQTASGWGESVTPCEDREKQVEGDGYSPPCFAFAEGADNGGETSPGVSGDTIKVTYRQTADPNLLDQTIRVRVRLYFIPVADELFLVSYFAEEQLANQNRALYDQIVQGFTPAP